MDDTKVTAHLPGLDIEVSRLANGRAEAIVIRMIATPSFDWLARSGMFPLMVAAESLQGWSNLLQAFWQPWLSLTPPPRR